MNNTGKNMGRIVGNYPKFLLTTNYPHSSPSLEGVYP